MECTKHVVTDQRDITIRDLRDRVAELEEYEEMVMALRESVQRTVNNEEGQWDCVCSNDPIGSHEHGCPAVLRGEIQGIVDQNMLLETKVADLEAQLKAVCSELGVMKLAYEMSEGLRSGALTYPKDNP